MLYEPHVDVIRKMKNKFDYREFTSLCERFKVEPMAMPEFAQLNGILQTAIIQFPKETHMKAFRLFMGEVNKFHEKRLGEQRDKMASMRGQSHETGNRPSGTRKCGGCGGAKNGGIK